MEQVVISRQSRLEMVGPNGLEPSTSSVSRKRSNQTELRAYTRTTVLQFYGAAGNSGNGELAFWNRGPITWHAATSGSSALQSTERTFQCAKEKFRPVENSRSFCFFPVGGLLT
jgi:hypothetical protein